MFTTKNIKVIDFLKQRRSTVAKKMSVGRVLKKDLNTILEIGTRVPDHGALKPWKIKIVQGNWDKFARLLINTYNFPETTYQRVRIRVNQERH